MTRSWNNVMRRIPEHCDDKGHGAFDDTVWNIVMTRILEHCDDNAMGHFDDIGMEHYDDKCSGAFC